MSRLRVERERLPLSPATPIIAARHQCDIDHRHHSFSRCYKAAMVTGRRGWASVWLIGAALFSAGLVRAERLTLHVEAIPIGAVTRIPPTDIVVQAATTSPATGLSEDARALVDAKRETAWCSAAPLTPDTSTVFTFTFRKAQLLDGIALIPYFARDFAHARNHGRIRMVDILTDAGPFHIELPDFVQQVEQEEAQALKVKGMPSCEDPDNRIRGVEFYLRFGRLASNQAFTPSPIVTSRVVLTLKRSYRGDRFLGACVSDVGFYRAQR